MVHLYRNIGSDIDVPAPDVGTNEQIMDWMTHKYSSLSNKKDLAVFTGKSLINGGAEGRSNATGLGVKYCIIKWAELNGIDLNKKTFILQGFGNVGSNTAILLHDLGLKLIAVGDHTCYLSNPEGFNIPDLYEYNKKNRSIKNFPGKLITKNEFFSIKCDIVIPAALELQIDKNIAQSIDCSLIIEAANGPTDNDADEILEERGIDLIPDILANSGGVAVSYLEWVQNKQYASFDLEYVNSWLEKKMFNTYTKVHQLSQKLDISKRVAAYYLALTNIDQKYQCL
jgi:glutamate dehydrogenase (NAD(P)+)